MRRCTTHRSSGAFSLIELLVVISIITLLVSILLPALAEARRAARQAVCMSNLHQFSIGFATYGFDFKYTIATYSWQPDRLANTIYSDLNPSIIMDPPSEDGEAYRERAIEQATDIARRRLGYDNLRKNFPAPEWLPHALYNHLVLNDYLGQRLPEPMVACPEDTYALAGRQRANDPAWWGADTSYPDWRVLAHSSYLTVPAAYSADKKRGSRTTSYPGAYHLEQWPGSQRLGARKLDDVSFPSQKVLMMDHVARHMAKPMYYGYDEAVQPVLFFDSSVRQIRSRDANPGFHPNVNPRSRDPLWITYQPDALLGEPPTRSGHVKEEVLARYQWTRGGLKGVDVAGNEITQ